jgi:hypothetical protein
MFTDELRLKFIMQDLEDYFCVDKDRFEYALEVALENGGITESITVEEELEGFRRMIDAAMTHYNFKG